MPRYQSTKTGKMVSEYYAKRHPATTVELQDAPKRAREIKARLKAEGRTFSDSTDLVRADRDGVPPGMLASLKDAMERNPRLRPGQLLVNALGSDHRLYNATEDEIADALDRFGKHGG